MPEAFLLIITEHVCDIFFKPLKTHGKYFLWNISKYFCSWELRFSVPGKNNLEIVNGPAVPCEALKVRLNHIIIFSFRKRWKYIVSQYFLFRGCFTTLNIVSTLSFSLHTLFIYVCLCVMRTWVLREYVLF